MKNIFVSLVVLFLGQVSFAGIHIEPYLGLEQGQLTAISGGNDISGKTSGNQLGLRLGYELPIIPLWFGLDYSLLSGGKVKPDFPALSTEASVNRTDGYLTVGFKFPILLNVWAGYGVMNSTNTKYDQGSDIKFTGGSHMKVGVGISFIPMVSLTVEAYQHKPGKVSVDGNDVDFGNKYSQFLDAGARVGISIPLSL